MRSIQRPVLIACSVALVVALVLGGRSLASQSAQSGPSGAGSAYQATAATTTSAALMLQSAEQPPVVHVAGAVRRPGVYTLKVGARARDAVRRAGGPTRRGDLNAINLAARISDGAQVIVPLKAAGVSGSAAPGSADGATATLVSLGNATAEQLDGLDGVGPATAEKIIQWRTEHGGFSSVDDLAEVPGIGPKKLEALRPQVTP